MLLILAASLSGCSLLAAPEAPDLPLGMYIYSEDHGIYVCARRDRQAGPALCGQPSIEAGRALRDDTCGASDAIAWEY